ncbi:hypothetical protein TIFTF001_028175 [Ficus carica]|uniref:Uncharacterized protein n=1 Tax=Ficus carica TaxID=3494 RepID=A0AA88DPE3_FICCA|nr:hypothetical protein TIFTF001_028175 [Ficus carica]
MVVQPLQIGLDHTADLRADLTAVGGGLTCSGYGFPPPACPRIVLGQGAGKSLVSRAGRRLRPRLRERSGFLPAGRPDCPGRLVERWPGLFLEGQQRLSAPCQCGDFLNVLDPTPPLVVLSLGPRIVTDDSYRGWGVLHTPGQDFRLARSTLSASPPMWWSAGVAQARASGVLFTDLLFLVLIHYARPSTRKYSNTQCDRVVRSRPASRSAAVTYKTKAPRNDGDTGVVFAAGTPMSKSVRELMSSAFRGLGCSGIPGRVGYGITQGQPLPGQVAAGGDVTRCRSGQAEPTADGTCVRKGVTGGARAPRALSL